MINMVCDVSCMTYMYLWCREDGTLTGSRASLDADDEDVDDDDDIQ